MKRDKDKTLILTFFLIFIFIINCSDINSAYVQIFVSTSGSDDNNGTYDKPFRSLSAAINYLFNNQNNINSDVHIILGEGVYYVDEPIIITEKDWNGINTLIIKGEKGKIPKIKGGIKLNKFEKLSDVLWKINLDNYLNNKINQLYVNGERAVLARTPNFGELFQTKSAFQKYLNDLSATQVIQLTDDQNKELSSSLKSSEKVITSFNHLWLNTQGVVNNYSEQEKTFSFTSPILSNVFNLNTSSQFFLENSISFLDTPGEWIINDGVLYYIPKYGETPNTAIAEIPILSELLVIRGTKNNTIKNIVIENISFQLTRHNISPKGYVYHQAAFDTNAAITVSYATDVKFINCEMTNLGNSAIWFHAGSSKCKLSESYIHNLGIGGIKIGITDKNINVADKTTKIIIENNIIHSGGLEVSNGVGVLIFNSGDNLITNNDISNFRYSGVSVGWTWGYSENDANNNKILNNHIHHIGWAELSDLGGIYILGANNTQIKNNVIHDVFSFDYKGWGVYLDEGAINTVIENNLVYNCKSSAFHQHYGKNNIIKNNIFANQILSQLELTKIEKHNSFSFTNNIVYYKSGFFSHNYGWRDANFIADNNLYWNPIKEDVLFYNMGFEEWKKKTGKDINSIIEDPLLVDPDINNYNFKSTRVIEKINFKPFDYSKAGVYGDKEWKQKAILKSDIINKFNAAVNHRIEVEGLSK